MKLWELGKKVGDLSDKLKDVPCDGIRLDFESFPEAEKLLFRKVWEIKEKYGDSPPADVIEANMEFIFKAAEVVSWRVLQMFMFVMRMSFGGDEIEEWYFKLHFYNFFEDLKECLQRVRKWSEKDREEFLRDMKESGMLNKVFRIPRGSSGEDLKRRSRQERHNYSRKSKSRRDSACKNEQSPLESAAPSFFFGQPVFGFSSRHYCVTKELLSRILLNRFSQ